MDVKNLVGHNFGRIKVIAELEKRNSRSVSMCRCQCGTEWVVDNRFLKNGNTKSCGKCGVSGNFKHGHGKAAAQSPTYQSWTGMHNRCYNPKQRSYKTYGALGITVCESWKANFKNFLADMGERPAGMTLDRIDNSKGYSKSNCRWATSKEQGRNKTTSVELTANGETLKLHEWAEKTGVRAPLIRNRLLRGWTAEQAVNTPVKAKSNFQNNT